MFGLAWLGLACLGFAWLGLACFGLAWLALPWLGLAYLPNLPTYLTTYLTYFYAAGICDLSNSGLAGAKSVLLSSKRGS